jgi:hypothetical protein
MFVKHRQRLRNCCCENFSAYTIDLRKMLHTTGMPYLSSPSGFSPQMHEWHVCMLSIYEHYMRVILVHTYSIVKKKLKLETILQYCTLINTLKLQ